MILIVLSTFPSTRMERNYESICEKQGLHGYMNILDETSSKIHRFKKLLLFDGEHVKHKGVPEGVDHILFEGLSCKLILVRYSIIHH